jgi:hypothetical protein
MSSRRRAPGEASKDEASRGIRRFLSHPSWAGIGAIAAVLALVGTAAAVLAILPSDQHPPANQGRASAAPNIEVDSVTAQYLPKPRGIPARPVQIDFEIRNTGNQLAIIKDARVTVEQFAALPVCFSAGELESTGTYHAFLPENPLPGTSVDIPTAQTIGPDAAVRFDITLGLPATTNQMDPTIYIYRLRIGLLYDKSSAPADAGEAVIALPVAPYDTYFWTKQYAAHPTNFLPLPGSAIPTVSRCLVNNSRKLDSILAMTGVCPAELTTVQSQLSTWDPARH